jgi:hypothetical protein
MYKTIKPLFIIALLVLVGTTTLAKKTIRGTVTDASTGENLSSTNILIEDTYHGTITNENGVYSLTVHDSLQPATLVVQYIGYQTQRRTITLQSSQQQDFALEPAVTEMEEIVVTDEDPGVRIMREVIKRKQQWRQKLETYRADAYTRQTLSNDTAIVSISESASEVFWDKEQGHREVQKSKRQTANLQEDQNFAGVSYLPNFYDDDIEISGFELVGVAHPDALDYYDFKLLDQTSLDDQTVFEIRVDPARKLQPLFEGTVFVLDEEYALLEVDLQPNDVVTFPPPVKSFTTSYKQQFNNFGQEFWLPVDVRIGGDIKIKMVGLDFPMIKFKQVSRITNYRVNTSLPDSLYQGDDLFTVDSTTVGSDSLITEQIDVVPLSPEEEEAYATVDSTATLEEAFKPSGFLADMMDDNDGSSGSSLFSFLDGIPGNISPDGRYNRVDEVFAGLKYRIDLFDQLELRAKGGYSTGYNEWNYGGGFSIRWLTGERLISTLGWDYAAETTTRYTSHIYNPYYAIIPNLTGNDGYFGYYRSDGFRAFSKFRYQPRALSVSVGFRRQDHRSLTTATAYDLFGADNYRSNPPIAPGTMQTVDVVAGYNVDESYNFAVTSQKYLRFEIEHSSDVLGSDFNFTRYETRLSWSFPTFYQRRFLSNTLDINLKAGTYGGELPAQKLGIVDVSIGKTSPYGVMKAARGRPYEGRQYLSLNLEHNFRTIPFEAIGLRPLVDRNIGLILFGGAARTWPDWNSQNTGPLVYQPRGTNGIHWEAGASLNGILGLFRVDFATRLDEPAFLVSMSIARLF